MKYLFLILTLIGFYSVQTIAQTKDLTKSLGAKNLESEQFEEPEELIDSRIINSANRDIREMRASDPGGDRLVNIRMGMVQITSNTSGLEFSPNQTMATYGPEVSFKLWRNFSLEARYIQNKNIIEPTSEINDKTAFQKSTDLGIMYRFVLDEAKPSNYLGLRIQTHITENNFALEDYSNTIIVNKYKGLILGVNKGIPITSYLGLDASLDMLSITGAETLSDLEISSKGYGFTVRGEVYYTREFFRTKLRFALAYWQSSYINEFEDAYIDLIGKQNQVQTYRMISGSFGLLF